MNRRKVIKSFVASTIAIPLAGCSGGAKAVVVKYDSGYTLFQKAKAVESEGGNLNRNGEKKKAREKWDSASSIYSSSAKKFGEAKQAAEKEEVRKHCERASRLAEIKKKEMEDLAKGNKGEALMHLRNSYEYESRVVKVEIVKDAATSFI